MSTVASIALRPKIREIMKATPSQRWNEEALVTMLQPRIPGARATDVLDAMVWNLSKGYVVSSRDDEMDCDMWTLTKEGKNA